MQATISLGWSTMIVGAPIDICVYFKWTILKCLIQSQQPQKMSQRHWGTQKYIYVCLLQVGNSGVQCKVISLLSYGAVPYSGKCLFDPRCVYSTEKPRPVPQGSGSASEHPCGITRPTAPKWDTGFLKHGGCGMVARFHPRQQQSPLECVNSQGRSLHKWERTQ